MNNHEMIAVVLKNDTLATRYFAEYFPETEVYTVDEESLKSESIIEEIKECFKVYADSFDSERLTIAFGVGNLSLATYLHEYAKQRSGYFYMLEPNGIIKVA